MIVAVQLAIGLPLVELALRALLPPLPSTHVVPTEVYVDARASQTSHDGGEAHYDADGYRDEGHLPGAARSILFLGDSFTLGYGVPDGGSFVMWTEHALALQSVRVRCLNAGFSGFGTPQELMLLRARIATVNAIVLQLFPFNDLTDARADGRFALEHGALIEHARVQPDPPWRERLYLARVLTDGWTPVAIPHVDDADLALERALLDEVVRTARAHALPILLVVVGEQHECAPGAPPGTPYRRVLDDLASHHVPLLPLCERTPSPSDFSADGHYTIETNQRVGEAIAERLAPLLR